MPSPVEITVSQLSRAIGLPGAPLLIDVRPREEFETNRHLLPTARHLECQSITSWAEIYRGQRVVIYCGNGDDISQGAAAWLRQAGTDVLTLEGGFEAWSNAKQPLLRPEKLPDRDDAGRTIWVTRARPKIIRIACPWLIRRFVDPTAVFLFVPPSDVPAVSERFRATPSIPGMVFGTIAETPARSMSCSKNSDSTRNR